MMRLALRLACLLAAPCFAAQEQGKVMSYMLPYSESWEDQLVERGMEFTELHEMVMEDFRTEILDNNDARVRRGDKPGQDVFPLRVRFLPKDGGGVGAPHHSFVLDHTLDWQSKVSAQMVKFANSLSMVPLDRIRVTLSDVNEKRVRDGEVPAADRFPIKVLLQAPESQEAEDQVQAPADERGFKLKYSKDWPMVMGRRMKYFGREHDVTPDKYWPKIVDNTGELVDTSQDVPKTSFPLHVSFVLREGQLDEHLTELSEKLFEQWESEKKETDGAKEHRIAAKKRAELEAKKKHVERAEL